jgi:hypothetical protein
VGIGCADPAGQRLQAGGTRHARDAWRPPHPTRARGSPASGHLAWRLDGGQLASADQLLARLCGIPTNDVAMASIVLLREVAHSVAPVLQRPPIEILDHLRVWLAGRPGASG